MKAILTFLVLLYTSVCMATPTVDMNKNYWQCTVEDQEHKQWSSKSNYQKTALNYAIESCKKESKAPASCTSISQSCQEFNADKSDRPRWRCVAVDEPGSKWISDYTNDRDSAALNALAICKSQSPLPATCFMDVVTCSVYIEGVKQ